MKKWSWRIIRTLLIVSFFLWLANSSWLSGFFTGDVQSTDIYPKFLAHRGAAQTFSQKGLKNDTCTAQRIYKPSHNYLENTLPSMKEAFAKGADIVEIDVHLTQDKVFAVFHDWTVDCRTDGKGVTHKQTMAALKQLDVGYGYTADGGKTFPFRGKGVGLMPRLEEVFAAFPDKKFLINYKSRRKEEGTALAVLLEKNPAWRKQVFGVYGGLVPTREAQRLVAGLRGYDKKSVKSCLLKYLALGWSSYVPHVCRNAIVPVPKNLGWLLWGWPHKFTRRMQAAGSDVILLGPYKGGGFSSGVDTLEMLKTVPQNFNGYIWTNRIELIAPAARKELDKR